MNIYILSFYDSNKYGYKIERYELNIIKHIKRELEKGSILMKIEERKI